MRLDVSRLGLLTWLFGLAVAGPADGGDDKQREITATTTTSSPNAVVSIDTLSMPACLSVNPAGKTIYYKQVDPLMKLTFLSISLKTFNNNGVVGVKTLTSSTAAAPKPPSLSGQVLQEVGSEVSIMERQAPPEPNPVPFIVNTTLAAVTVAQSGLISLFDDVLNDALYLEFSWENSTSRGTSTSSLFAIYTDEYELAKKNLHDTGKETGPAWEEAISPLGGIAPTGVLSSGITSTTVQPVATEPASETSPVDAVVAGGGGGLSQGATIGIGVGVGVGVLLIIISLVAFFILRRRKQNAARHQRMQNMNYSSDSGVHAMMTDKEVPIVSEESEPHPTYGNEDGTHLHGTAAAAGRASNDAYAPYSDRAPTPGQQSFQQQHQQHPSGGAVSGATSSQTDLPAMAAAAPSFGHARTDSDARSPTPIATRYAHLVEEGMTEDEIRRLEEEERVLDAAIEDAGRQSRLANQPQ